MSGREKKEADPAKDPYGSYAPDLHLGVIPWEWPNQAAPARASDLS
jgi:hypothetical protein